MPPAPTGAVGENEPARWFREEVHVHDAQLKNYLKGKFPDVADIEDITQESYVTLWKMKAVQPIRSAKSYLFTVARHLAINLLRRQKISPVSAVSDLGALNVLEEGPDAAEAAIAREKMDLAYAVLMALPPRTREVVILRKLKGLSQKETAEALGISVKTVDTMLGNGLDKMEELLRKRGLEGASR